MLTETLPIWFWVLYYLFLIITLGTTIFCVAKRKIKNLSLIASIVTVILPIITLANSMGRAQEMNEFNHLISQLQQGTMWSIFATVGYLFLLGWWILFLSRISSKE